MIPALIGRVIVKEFEAEIAGEMVEAFDIPVNSSAIASFHYDPEDEELTITFTGGNDYTYTDVPSHIILGLIASPSKGQYFNTVIKDNY